MLIPTAVPNTYTGCVTKWQPVIINERSDEVWRGPWIKGTQEQALEMARGAMRTLANAAKRRVSISLICSDPDADAERL